MKPKIIISLWVVSIILMVISSDVIVWLFFSSFIVFCILSFLIVKYEDEFLRDILKDE